MVVSPLLAVILEAAESLATPRTPNEGSMHLATAPQDDYGFQDGGSWFGRLMPAKSKTVRQFPCNASAIAASACWIRSCSFEWFGDCGFLWLSLGFFRSFGAGLFFGSDPQL